MVANKFKSKFIKCFVKEFDLLNLNERSYINLCNEHDSENQTQTNNAFSEKWAKYDYCNEQDSFYDFQLNWYLELYGFGTEQDFCNYLSDKDVIFDAGCGLGYKAAWFAELAPHALVIGMDFSEAAELAADRYKEIPNLFFVRGDIADTGIKDSVISFTSCDQVIMHTQDPEATYTELARITERRNGEFACYFYAKKALPRELLDDYFRKRCKELTSTQLWEMSEQLTQLGKTLSELKVTFEAPDIPELGIKGGVYDIQRFIYWNFLKCFWNENLGKETSKSTNFDWYSPSNARRFSEKEVKKIVKSNGMKEIYFHKEEACYSGRFKHL